MLYCWFDESRTDHLLESLYTRKTTQRAMNILENFQKGSIFGLHHFRL